MLPPGHVAAGYLASEILLKLGSFDLSSSQMHQLVLWGTFFGFMPDLDFFYAFFKTHAFKIDNTVVNHRKFISHAPLVWLLISTIVFLLSKTPFMHAWAILLFAGTWTHFILDTEWGIMWLWPFSTRLFPLSQAYYQKKYSQNDHPSKETGFWNYWFTLVKNVYLHGTGFIELSLICIAIIYFLINKI